MYRYPGYLAGTLASDNSIIANKKLTSLSDIIEMILYTGNSDTKYIFSGRIQNGNRIADSERQEHPLF